MTNRLFTFPRWLAVMALLGLLALPQARAQARAGEITHLQGMATAQQPSGDFRFLGKGDVLQEGDTVTTTDKGFAVLTLADGSKITLRPSTTFAIERFAHGQGTESLLMSLLKGGVRMVTGLTGKLNPSGVELRTTTATVGIRGTSFDARLCGDDCREEGVAPETPQRADGTSMGTPPPVVARLVVASGTVTATLPGQPARPLTVGGSLYEGDELRTAAGAVAVVGFRDQTKVSVNPDTTLRINAYRYNQPQAADSVALELVKGAVRGLTGLIARSSPNAIQIKTHTSNIGIRGTGMDISCEGPCADPGASGEPPPAMPGRDDGLFMLTWDGATYFELGPLDVGLDQIGFIGRDGQPRLLDSVPEFMAQFTAPRPDTVEVDWDNLFASVSPTGADGLYVYVREGHVFIVSGGSRIDLGAGEAGYVGEEGRAERIFPVPGFLSLDPYPLPEFFTQTDGQILQLYGVTLGRPGQEICRF